MRGSFWWQSILKLLNTFNGIAEAEAGTGRTILFWKDVWNGCIMEISYPHLYSFTKSENISLQSVLSMEELHDLFNLLLSKFSANNE
jgi:hypothetical protein